MFFHIITAFPNAFSYLNESMLRKAQLKKLIQLSIIDLREFGIGKRKKIDDRPFGGGAGMLLQVDPVYKALKSLGVYPNRKKNTKIILTSPRGTLWNQSIANQFSQSIKHVVIICGHYEGVDERISQNLVDEEVSIGNYILSGGELASMIIVDSISRLIPGVLGNENSPLNETSFDYGQVSPEHPQYTRPEIYKTEEGQEWKVPQILLSGNHAAIKQWQNQ